MAIAKVDLVCEYCGETFTYRRKCINANQAEQAEEWAKENITVCPTCYKKNELERLEYRNKESGFPPLIGSDKQNAWAENIRREFYDKWIVRANTPKEKEFLRYIMNTKVKSAEWIENNKYFTDKTWLRNIYDEFMERKHNEELL